MSNEPTSRVPSSGGDPSRHDAPTSAMLRQPGWSEPVPERIGPYKVIREVGRGGMGSVLLAIKEDDKFAKTVAIKLVKRGMDTADILHRFNVERQVLSALNHPNIARVFDAGAAADGRPYFVMEHVDGLPITTYCDTNQLPTLERLKLFEKVCSAVHHAHQNLVVHRDLKPGNILVDANGEPKLLDFGIAKLLNADLMGTPMVTGPELRLMTPEYASPEQVQGLPISTASDVYSLGVLLYELLTGHAPYRFKSRLQEEIVRIVCEVEPEKPSTAVSRVEEVMTAEGTTRTLTPEDVARAREAQPQRLRRRLSGDLDNIVLMAMRKSPKRRYQSAEQFAEDIQRHLDGRPVIARRDTFFYRTGKFVQRNRWGVAAAAAMLALLVLGAAGTTVGMLRARAALDKAVIAENAAVAAEGVAKQRLEATRTSVSEFLRDYSRSILKLKGSAPARQLLVQTSLQMLNGLESKQRDDPAAQAMFADAYYTLGTLQAAIRSPGESDTKAALDSYQRALAIHRALVPGGGPDACRSLAATLIGLATVEWRVAKQQKEATAHLDEALQTLRPLAASDRNAKRLLAVALLEKGDLLRALGKGRDAEVMLVESFQLRQELAKGHEKDPEAQRDLSTGYIRIAQLAADKGDTEKEVEGFRRALEIRKALNESDSANGRTTRDEMLACQQFAHSLTKLDTPRWDEALSHQTEVVKQFDLLYQADETDTRALEDYTVSAAFLAGLLRRDGQADNAMKLAKLAVERSRQAAESDTARNRLLFACAQAHGVLGDLSADRQEFDLSGTQYKQAIEYVERLRGRLPDDVAPFEAEIREKLRSSSAKRK